MQDRRRPPGETTPEYEDSGLFRNAPGQITVELVPRFGLNSRQDVMIQGFVSGNMAIDVVFAGRRRPQVTALVDLLRQMWTKANRQIARNGKPPEIDDVRLAVRIEGAWRQRFARDDQGWQTRTHQLIAARWLIVDDHGEVQEFGEPPVHPSFYPPTPG